MRIREVLEEFEQHRDYEKMWFVSQQDGIQCILGCSADTKSGMRSRKLIVTAVVKGGRKGRLLLSADIYNGSVNGLKKVFQSIDNYYAYLSTKTASVNFPVDGWKRLRV